MMDRIYPAAATAAGMAAVAVALARMLFVQASENTLTTPGRFYRNWPFYSSDMFSGHGSRAEYGCIIIRGSDEDASALMLRLWRTVSQTACPWYVVLEREVSQRALEELGERGGVTFVAFRDGERLGARSFERVDDIQHRDMIRFAVEFGLV